MWIFERGFFSQATSGILGIKPGDLVEYLGYEIIISLSCPRAVMWSAHEQVKEEVGKEMSPWGLLEQPEEPLGSCWRGEATASFCWELWGSWWGGVTGWCYFKHHLHLSVSPYRVGGGKQERDSHCRMPWLVTILLDLNSPGIDFKYCS